MQTLYRFELSFGGEEQGVGFLQGLDDTPIPAPIRDDLYGMFDSLPVPPTLTTPDDSPVMCWFTEKGLRQFADALNAVIYELSVYDWQVIVMPLCIDTDKPVSLQGSDALYADAYQMVFSYADFRETNDFDFKEIFFVDKDAPQPLVYRGQRPSLDTIVDAAKERSVASVPTQDITSSYNR